MTLLNRAARAAMGVPFVILGYQAAADPGGRVDKAAELGLGEPETAVIFNGAAMVAGGAALTLGILPRAAATGLIASLIPTTVAGHAFWKIEDPAARAGQRTQAIKNLALIGGLAAIALQPSATSD